MRENGNNLKDYNCKRCGFSQARTDGVDLYFGLRPVPLKPIQVSWLCIKCKAEVRWRKKISKTATASERQKAYRERKRNAQNRNG